MANSMITSTALIVYYRTVKLTQVDNDFKENSKLKTDINNYKQQYHLKYDTPVCKRLIDKKPIFRLRTPRVITTQLTRKDGKIVTYFCIDKEYETVFTFDITELIYNKQLSLWQFFEQLQLVCKKLSIRNIQWPIND